MSNSPFSDLMEAIKKACFDVQVCQAIESFHKVIAALNAKREEIERQKAEALEREMATALDAGDTTTLITLLDMIKEAQDMCKEEPPAINDNMEWERPFWRGATALARSRMAARAQAFARKMEQEKARQAMKRRKLKHADGSFPDWECGCLR